VLASTADFLHRQGVGDAAAAVDDARKEIKLLRWALREACDVAWSDGEAAMAQYLRRAESAALDDERQS
jgi:hypothetical protein